MTTTTTPAKKKLKLSPFVWGAMAAGCLVRTFYRPHRAVAAEGFPARCSGDGGCKPGMLIDTPGAVGVYAVTSGKVAITGDAISIASDREPVVVTYSGRIASVFVATGQDVGIGKLLGLIDDVDFSVTEIVRDMSGRVTFRALEPASYLAARGLGITVKGSRPSALWCSHGRRLTIPKATLNCGVKIGDPSALLLLPVSVTSE